MILISVIIPVYEAEDVIERAINSVINQDFNREIELMIIDDCGSDSSIEIAKHTIERHKNGISTRIIHHPRNFGIGESTNTGIKEARGQYLFFLDADDVISQDCLSKLYSFATSNRLDVCIGSMRTIWNNQTYTDYSYKEVIINSPSAGLELFRQGINVYGSRWNKLYRTSFLRDNNINCKQRIWEDQFFSFLVSCYANRLGIIADITYFYYQSAPSVSNTLCIKRPPIESLVSIIIETRNIIKDKFCNVPGIYDSYLVLVRFSYIVFLKSSYSLMDYKRFYKLTKDVNSIIPSKKSLLLRRNKMLFMLKIDNILSFHVLYVMQNALRIVKENCHKMILRRFLLMLKTLNIKALF